MGHLRKSSISTKTSEREKALGTGPPFKIRVIVVAVVTKRQACDWRVAIFLALPPNRAMTNTFPLETPQRSASNLSLPAPPDQRETVAVRFHLRGDKYEDLQMSKDVTMTFFELPTDHFFFFFKCMS